MGGGDIYDVQGSGSRNPDSRMKLEGFGLGFTGLGYIGI